MPGGWEALVSPDSLPFAAVSRRSGEHESVRSRFERACRYNGSSAQDISGRIASGTSDRGKGTAYTGHQLFWCMDGREDRYP